MRKFTSLHIGSRVVAADQPCFIIAEAGVNHNGQLDMALQLIDAASAAGVDAVKFQTYKTEDLILEGIEKAVYQQRTTKALETQTEMLKRLEIGRDFHLELIRHCTKRGILFLSTCYDEASLNLLVELNIKAIKIASTDTTNVLFLEKVAMAKKPVILSTGMCSYDEIKLAYDCLVSNGCPEIALLKCTTNYPTELKDVNLRAMGTLADHFDAVIGFSDHTKGLGASVYAVAQGAKIVEKHFTLDKNLPGPDHQASLDPQELKAWVDEIRNVETMLGSPELVPSLSEIGNKKAMQKCLVAKGDLRKGDVLSRMNLNAKRTGGLGISAARTYDVLGKILVRDVAANQPLLAEDMMSP